ncbi:hypothetical protein LCGC14_1168730 [marine sediment metagenome]|uniref:Uncharacterized protein n=1 Tax=marine sediment metagenome TaxID=412755 RepID=A0A0F9LVE2_9ZZZZ
MTIVVDIITIFLIVVFLFGLETLIRRARFYWKSRRIRREALRRLFRFPPKHNLR